MQSHYHIETKTTKQQRKEVENDKNREKKLFCVEWDEMSSGILCFYVRNKSDANQRFPSSY